jgi:hypothetical protein
MVCYNLKREEAKILFEVLNGPDNCKAFLVCNAVVSLRWV